MGSDIYPGNNPEDANIPNMPTKEEKRYLTPHKNQPYIPKWPSLGNKNFATDDAKLQWQRQLAFVKDDDPANGFHYYVFRDTVKTIAPVFTKPGDKDPTPIQQPSEWIMWTLSRGLYDVNNPRKKKIEVDYVGKGGELSLDYQVRSLSGDRFFAYGQRFDSIVEKDGKKKNVRQDESERVDVEYFVAAPSTTPRYTIHWGTFFTSNRDRYRDFQDLLHLQLPGDGHYFVVAFPRRNVEEGEWRAPAPTFSNVANSGGNCIRIKGQSQGKVPFDDFVFVADKNQDIILADVETPIGKKGLRFVARMASIQFRNNKLRALCLASNSLSEGRALKEGTVEVGGYGLYSKYPCSMLIDAKGVTIDLPEDKTGGSEVKFKLPAGQRVSGITENKGLYVDTVTQTTSYPFV